MASSRFSRFSLLAAACAGAILACAREVRDVIVTAVAAVGVYVLKGLELAGASDSFRPVDMPHADPGLTQRQRHDLNHQPLERAHRLPAWSMCPST